MEYTAGGMRMESPPYTAKPPTGVAGRGRLRVARGRQRGRQQHGAAPADLDASRYLSLSLSESLILSYYMECCMEGCTGD
jgi:hypothetical protein